MGNSIARILFGTALLLHPGVGRTQSPTPGGMPPPPGMTMAASAAMRFPQPVRVGDLIGRDVLRPVESQDLLGRVRHIVRNADGETLAVLDFGGFLGFGSRLIAVPLDAMVLLGEDMEVVALTPAQLSRLPTFSASASTPLADDTVIKVGLAKPSH